MAVQLFEHNQRAYLAVETMLAEVGKAAVIHPTGTGKSYIAFRLIEEHPDKTFLWLSPSDYIFKTQKESLQHSNPEFSLENVQFYTYAKLMLFTPAQIGELSPDYIILDEFHRCGAERWGEGVQALIGANPGALLLGLSATNIRYLDNQRDIAQELFDGHIASEMTLGEAIVRGILPRPRYVSTVFKYRKELETYQARISNIRVPALREINQSYYDALRRALEQADGLDAIIKKYVTNKSGKYLIFCSGYDHLQEMRSLTVGWFRTVNPEVHVYIAYSSDPETSRAFQNFKADNSDALKLLFCIDMLNEGVHVKGIAGVILFRPTMSPIIYKQQIGRALTSGDSTTPLILDIVNNFESLCSISAIQKEMENAADCMRQNGEEAAIRTERFEVEEQVHDCAVLFERLQSSLSTPWDHYFREAKKYYQEHGHLNVPKNCDTPEGLHLGQWLCTQRALYRNSRYRLSPEQIARLEDIGMQWQRCDDICWERNYEAALTYSQNYGHLRVPARYVAPDGIALGKWISNLRTQYRNGSQNLDRDQVEQLNKLGMVWDDIEAQWQHHYSLAAAFYDKHGHLNVPVEYVAEDGFALGRWLSQLRTAHRGISKRRITAAQIEQLDAIGMVWEKRGDSTWMKGYMIAQSHYRKFGHVDVPSNYKTSEGFALGKWISRQRYAYKNPGKSNSVLTERRIELLEEIGILTRDKRNLECIKRTYRAG